MARQHDSRSLLGTELEQAWAEGLDPLINVKRVYLLTREQVRSHTCERICELRSGALPPTPSNLVHTLGNIFASRGVGLCHRCRATSFTHLGTHSRVAERGFAPDAEQPRSHTWEHIG